MKKVVGVFFLLSVICLFFLEGQIVMALPDAPANHDEELGKIKELVENEPEKAIGMLHDLLARIDTEEDPALAADAQSLLGDAFYYLDNLDQSLAHYQQAAEINQLSGREVSDEQVKTLGYLGFLYDLKEQHLIALDHYNRALESARALGNKAEIATNLANSGKILTLQGNYRDALARMEEALAIDRAAGDESVIATDLNTIGRIYEAWGIFDKAAEYLEEALEIDQRLNLKDKIAIRLSGLGIVYKAWGKYEQALDYFNRALAIDRELKNEEKIALRQAHIGSTYLAMAQTDKALTFLHLGLDYFEKNQMTSYAAATLTDIGTCHMIRQEFRQAETAFLRSLELSRPGNLNRMVMNNLEMLSSLYGQAGQYEKAWQAQNEFIAIKDSIFTAESQKKLMEFQARFELDNKQQQIELIKRDQELDRKRLLNTRLIFTITGLVLTIILLAMLIRLRNQQNRRLKAEKENQALRANLEQKNKELTLNAMCIVKNNQTMMRMVEAVENSSQQHEDNQKLLQIIQNLQKIEQDKSWEEFEIHFIQTHQGFYDKLQARFPDLTPNERKLCAFLRLNMSTKDIAAITHQSVNSINVARTRLRKKLGIDSSDENLIGFLHNL